MLHEEPILASLRTAAAAAAAAAGGGGFGNLPLAPLNFPAPAAAAAGPDLGAAGVRAVGVSSSNATSSAGAWPITQLPPAACVSGCVCLRVMLKISREGV